MKILNKDSYILAAITGTLYLLSLMEMIAQSICYDIPLKLMSLDVLKLTLSSLFLLVLISPVLFLYVYFDFFKKYKNPLFIIVAILIWIVAIPVSFFLAFKSFNKILAIAIPAMWFLYCLYKLLKYKKHYHDLMFGKSWHYTEGDINIISGLSEGKKYFVVGVIFMCSFPGLFAGYYTEYMKKTEYDVFYKEGYYAVIAYSSDNVIAKRIREHRLAEGYYIFKTEALESKRIIKKDIRLIN